MKRGKGVTTRKNHRQKIKGGGRVPAGSGATRKARAELGKRRKREGREKEKAAHPRKLVSRAVEVSDFAGFTGQR